jgi:magnesium transporter
VLAKNLLHQRSESPNSFIGVAVIEGRIGSSFTGLFMHATAINRPSEVRGRRFTPQSTANSSPSKPTSGNGSNYIRIIRYDEKHCEDVSVDSAELLEAFLSNKLTQRVVPRRSGAHPEVPELKSNADTSRSEEAVDSKRITWIDVDGANDKALLDSLGKLFGLHPLALEDVVNVHQHAKLECYGNHIYFVARMPITGAKFSTEQVSLFLVDDVVITVQERPGDCLDPVRHRITKGIGRIRRRGADYLAYAIIDAIIDGYFPVLEPYDEELDRASDDVASSNQNLPLRLHQVRADLLLIRKVLLQHRDALNNLMREGADLVTPDTALYFRDCQDHINRLIEAADTDRETCGELRELYFAMLGEKNNAVMKVLTIIATIFIPMSFVAGLYGMNFDSSVSVLNMPELRWAYGYPFALATMALLASGLIYYLYRKGWLS